MITISTVFIILSDVLFLLNTTAVEEKKIVRTRTSVLKASYATVEVKLVYRMCILDNGVRFCVHLWKACVSVAKESFFFRIQSISEYLRVLTQ